MNLLAIDASSQNISLAVKAKGRLIINSNQKKQFGASLLIENIDKQLRKHRLGLNEIDAFVLGAGPGSFTGLRISFSLVKAFILALNKPAISIGSFFSCAYDLRNKAKRIAVISDARRNLIYGATFEAKAGAVKIQTKEKLYQLEQFIENKNDYFFVTYDRALRKQIIAMSSKINFYPKDVYPQAKNLLIAAEACYNKGKFTTIDKLKPLYLHPKTCQIRKR